MRSRADEVYLFYSIYDCDCFGMIFFWYFEFAAVDALVIPLPLARRLGTQLGTFHHYMNINSQLQLWTTGSCLGRLHEPASAQDLLPLQRGWSCVS